MQGPVERQAAHLGRGRGLFQREGGPSPDSLAEPDRIRGTND
jgi:hypothetical protein